jgi:light-regulated signal transduction histidine kinase (bacteriophytochrome)
MLSFWLQTSVTQPLLAVTGQARQVVEQRDYSLRANKTTNDEVGYLVDAFNAMLEEVQLRNRALEESNQQLITRIEERKEAENALRLSEQRVSQLNIELEQRVKQRTLQLEHANKELEAFSYSVSHDLRSPLRAIDGFSQALLEDYAGNLDEIGRDYLERVRKAAQRMGILIDDLLKLARVSRADMNLQQVNLSEITEEILHEFSETTPQRKVELRVTSAITAWCDPQLMNIVLQNLLHNAWKYTSKRANACIEFGMRQQNEGAVFFVQDNGAGFDMAYAGKLFGAFQRLHDVKEFPGTGVGLATVQRIINRHGGRIWAESAVNKGTVLYFTLPLPHARQASFLTGESDES